MISETNFYELHHRARLAIKPGITGMWQVSGRSDITDFEEVVRLDKEYIEKIDPDTQEPIIGEDGQPETEIVEMIIPRFRVLILPAGVRAGI